MIHISKHQLFCLFMLFEIGSTSLFSLGIEAKQDAWLAIIMALIGGLILLWFYTELQKKFPGANLTEIIITLLGKFLGIPLVLIYGLYFFYKSGIILREFTELVTISYLPMTPIIYILGSFLLVMFFVTSLGLEVLGRTSEIMLLIVLFFIFITYIFITISERVDLQELFPILGNGIKPVLYAGYPRILNFPFGETIVFFMYWKHVTPKEAIQKTSLLAMSSAGLLITISSIIIICTLGPGFAAISTIPFIEVIKLINIGSIITNLDAIGTTIIFICGFYKITIFFYGGILVLSTLFKIKNKKPLIVVLGIIIFYFSYTFVRSFPFNIWLGKKIHPFYINVAFQVINPILLLGIAWIKNKITHIKG